METNQQTKEKVDYEALKKLKKSKEKSKSTDQIINKQKDETKN